MLIPFRKLLAQNMIQRSIRYCQTSGRITIGEIFERKEKDLLDTLASTLANRTSLSVDEWKEFRSMTKMQRLPYRDNDILSAIKSLNITQDPLKIAESFIEAFNIDRNIIVILTFIDLYVAKAAKETLTQSEEDELIKLCAQLVENGMFRLPDVIGSVFNGFLATKEWKQILRYPKMYCARAPRNSLIDRALKENETELVLKLIESTPLQHSNDLLPETIKNYLNFLAKQQTSALDHVAKLLKFFEKRKQTIFEPVAEALINVLNQSNCEGKRVQIDSSGKCPNCEKSLIESAITDEEFRLLKEHFESEILHGKPHYHHLKPDDFIQLLHFIEKKGPFDVIMDGMNVALGSLCDDWREQGKLCDYRRSNLNELVDSVKQMENEGKRVLIIGKWNMYRLGINDLKSITSNIFLINNVRCDDILLLYAAMLCGPNTYMLTNDLMRDHKAEMSEKCRTLFEKWRRQRTLGYSFSEYYECQKIVPMGFQSYCQQNDGHWHVPFIANEERNQINWHESAKHWICLQLNPNQPNEHVNSNDKLVLYIE